MIKGLLMLFNLLGLFLCRLFFPVTVNVSQTAPFSASINNSFIVQVAINKGDLKGMAKFTEQLPAGLTAVPIDMEGAKTSFENNAMQFTWDSLPGDGILNISFRVDIGANASGVRDTLTGKFFYTADNQKLEADCMPSYITILGGATTAPAQAGITPHIVDSVKECQGGVFIKRHFQSPSLPPGTDEIVTIEIHKSTLSGFAKVEDSLPPGFTAAAVDASGASFTFVDNIAKFTWQSVPADSVLRVTYRIIAGSDVTGTHAVSGNFSYIYSGAPITCSIGTTIFNTGVVSKTDSIKGVVTPPSPSTAVVPVANTGENNAAVATVPVSNADIANQQGQSASQPAKPANYLVMSSSGNVVTNRPDTVKDQSVNGSVLPSSSTVTPAVPAPVAGINYRVQIMALHTPVDVSYFSLHKHINMPVNLELNGGFTKYTVGNYPDYKAVRSSREDIRKRGIVGPFVVCYNSGTRITVQEALMIIHQQWYK